MDSGMSNHGQSRFLVKPLVEQSRAITVLGKTAGRAITLLFRPKPITAITFFAKPLVEQSRKQSRQSRTTNHVFHSPYRAGNVWSYNNNTPVQR